MIHTYNIRELQTKITKLCRGDEKFVIANRNKPVFVALPVADYEALLETLHVMSDPKARQAIQKAREGTASYVDLDLNDENFGL